MDIFLVGDDSITLGLRKDVLRQDFFAQFPEASVQRYSFTAGDTKEVARAIENLAPSFFALPELFLLEDISVLGRPEQKRLLDALTQKPAEKKFIARESKNLPKSDALYKDLVAAGIPMEVFLKKERSRASLVAALWERHGGKRLPEKLTAEIGNRIADDEELLTRLETVLLYSGGTDITPEELDVLVPVSLEAKIFDALDLLALGKTDKALTTFRILLTEEDVFRLLSMCAWQIRQMLTVEGYMKQGTTDKASIATQSKIHPFVVQKIQTALRSFSHQRLVAALTLLAEIDRGLKKSEYTPVGALDTFVLKI